MLLSTHSINDVSCYINDTNFTGLSCIVDVSLTSGDTAVAHVVMQCFVNFAKRQILKVKCYYSVRISCEVVSIKTLWNLYLYDLVLKVIAGEMRVPFLQSLGMCCYTVDIRQTINAMFSKTIYAYT